MTDDDKALVERLAAEADNFKVAREVDMRGMLYRAADRIEALSAENERLREKLIGIRAEIDDMENPFNGGGAPEMAHGFEVAVDQAVNIVTAALEGGE